MDGTIFSQPKPSAAHELFEMMFHRAMGAPAEIREAFPEGCPRGTVSKILDLAISVNPTSDHGLSAWLLYRWSEGRLTLSEMKKSGPTLEAYAKRVGELPLEARNVFGIHSLQHMEDVLSRAVQSAPSHELLFSSRTAHATFGLA